MLRPGLGYDGLQKLFAVPKRGTSGASLRWQEYPYQDKGNVRYTANEKSGVEVRPHDERDAEDGGAEKSNPAPYPPSAIEITFEAVLGVLGGNERILRVLAKPTGLSDCCCDHLVST